MATVQSKSYRKPPITEATIAFHFPESFDERVRERFRVKQVKDFPRADELRDVKVAIGPAVAVEQSVSGLKLTSADGLSVVILAQQQLSVSRMAPYVDWDDLMTSARRNWDVLAKIIGIPRIRAISSRYQNRIDIPCPGGASVNYTDYFNLLATDIARDTTKPLANFYLNTISPSLDGMFQYNLKFGTANPVLIDHTSFLLDIDTSTAGAVPSRPDDMWALFAELRQRKNNYFEDCLKDNTRKLFE